MSKSKHTKSNIIIQWINFLKADIWRIRANTLSGTKSFWIRQIRIVLLAVRGFAEDKCQLRASALTFYSLLSIVPVVAMAFGIAKGFGFEKTLEKLLREKMVGQEEVLDKVITFSNTFLENTQGGVIAGVGVALLFWATIKVLGNIENSFNDIWGIKKGRSIGRKLSDYMSIMLICPVLLIMSSSVTVIITSEAKLLMDKLVFLGPIANWVLAILNLLPYAVLWVLFSFIYIFMPNTKVNFKSGLIAGIIAGTIYQLVQWAYINFQFGVSKYGAIYGSFAALPLFLVWLQLSWLIVLFGAEVSFAEQNVETYEFEPDSLKVSNAFKKLLALNITHLCVKNFSKAQLPWTTDEISRHLEIPIRLARLILFDLTEAGVLVEVKINDSKTTGYQPARDIEALTIQTVINLLEHHGIDNIPISETQESIELKERLKNISADLEKSSENILLRNIP